MEDCERRLCHNCATIYLLSALFYLQTFASSRFNVFLDIWVSTAFYLLLEIVMACVYGIETDNYSWLVYLVRNMLYLYVCLGYWNTYQ